MNESGDTSVDTVFVPCPLCGCGSSAIFMEVRGYRIVRCAGCAFLFVNPRPTETSLGALYSRDGNPYRDQSYEPVGGELRVLRDVVGRIRVHAPGGALIEVGCARGDLLRLARDAGYAVTGCDFFGGRRPADPDISFVDGTLRDAALPEESFNVVVNRNILEHTFDPRAEILEMKRILKPRGHLYLKVPNADFEHGWRCRLAFRCRHFFEPPYHLNYFDPASLKRLLSGAGLEFLSWSLERPSLVGAWSSDLPREMFYHLSRGLCSLTSGSFFPQIALICFARKRPGG